MFWFVGYSVSMISHKNAFLSIFIISDNSAAYFHNFKISYFSPILKIFLNFLVLRFFLHLISSFNHGVSLSLNFNNLLFAG